MAFQLRSPAFSDRQTIPREYTGEGRDSSPPLEWKDVPDGAKELALICEDPDAPMDEPFVHWVAYKIPVDATSLPEGLPAESHVNNPIRFVQGRNSFAKTGYGGPMPPRNHGRHRYYFRLIALDQPLPDRDGLDKHALEREMQGHIIGETQLMGIYERH